VRGEKMSEQSEQVELTLADSAIAQIARLLQVAILTGTDVVDNLRTLRLTEADGKLEASDDYVQAFNDNLQTMLDNVPDDAESTE
tara:strand:- start:54 stop:308 length:255 start_codon:yes stop_codon:yes gene_type:complete